jgi:hypothetical protein
MSLMKYIGKNNVCHRPITFLIEQQKYGVSEVTKNILLIARVTIYLEFGIKINFFHHYYLL